MQEPEPTVKLERVHAPALLNSPLLSELKLTIPIGVVGLVFVSVTVTVQVEAWLTTTVTSQLMLVDVGRRRTDISKKPELGR